MILSLVNTFEELTGITPDSTHLSDCLYSRLIPQEHRLNVVCIQGLSSHLFKYESRSPLTLFLDYSALDCLPFVCSNIQFLAKMGLKNS